ncbi:MAG TPA: hypothetical protein VGO71_15990 [Baekduia sp.]|jgi:hypothetical protein|nr:hypothetical protein [Baekduia sp.]
MRLRLLVIAVVAALAIPSLALARTATKGDPRDQHQAAGIVGTWDVQVSPDGQTPFPALLTFNQGGTLVETESDAPGTGLGSWKQIDSDRFALSFKTFIVSGTGQPAGAVVVRSVGTLKDDSLSGPFEFDVLDTAGNVIPSQSDSGTATATPFTIPDL